MDTDEIIAKGRRCIDIEAEALMKTSAQLDSEVDVFVSGEGGYNTYRIPAVIWTQEGTLIAFAEGRKSQQLVLSLPR